MLRYQTQKLECLQKHAAGVDCPRQACVQSVSSALSCYVPHSTPLATFAARSAVKQRQ